MNFENEWTLRVVRAVREIGRRLQALGIVNAFAWILVGLGERAFQELIVVRRQDEGKIQLSQCSHCGGWFGRAPNSVLHGGDEFIPATLHLIKGRDARKVAEIDHLFRISLCELAIRGQELSQFPAQRRPRFQRITRLPRRTGRGRIMNARAHEENATPPGHFFREDGHCFAAGRGRSGRAHDICRAHVEKPAAQRYEVTAARARDLTPRRRFALLENQLPQPRPASK